MQLPGSCEKVFSERSPATGMSGRSEDRLPGDEVRPPVTTVLQSKAISFPPADLPCNRRLQAMLRAPGCCMTKPRHSPSPFETRSLIEPIEREACRSIRHDPVITAVRAFRTRLLGFEDMESIQDSILHAFLDLTRKGNLDTALTADTMCIWQMLSNSMGTDCSYGLSESLYLCLRLSRTEGEPRESKECTNLGPPVLSASLSLTPDLCVVHVRCSSSRITMQSNARFEAVFGSMEEIRQTVWQLRIEPIYVWSKFIDPSSRDAFYRTLTHVLFSNRTDSASCLLQCRTADSLPLTCLMTVSLARRAPTPPSSPSSGPSSPAPDEEEGAWGYSVFFQPYSPGLLAFSGPSPSLDDAPLPSDSPPMPTHVAIANPTTEEATASPSPTYPEAGEQALPEDLTVHQAPSLKRSRPVDAEAEPVRCHCRLRPRHSPEPGRVVY